MAQATFHERRLCGQTMKAAVLVEPGRIVLEDKPVPFEEAYDLFANQRDGVLKVAISPS